MKEAYWAVFPLAGSVGRVESFAARDQRDAEVARSRALAIALNARGPLVRIGAVSVRRSSLGNDKADALDDSIHLPKIAELYRALRKSCKAAYILEIDTDDRKAEIVRAYPEGELDKVDGAAMDFADSCPDLLCVVVRATADGKLGAEMAGE